MFITFNCIVGVESRRGGNRGSKSKSKSNSGNKYGYSASSYGGKTDADFDDYSQTGSSRQCSPVKKALPAYIKPGDFRSSLQVELDTFRNHPEVEQLTAVTLDRNTKIHYVLTKPQSFDRGTCGAISSARMAPLFREQDWLLYRKISKSLAARGKTKLSTVFLAVNQIRRCFQVRKRTSGCHWTGCPKSGASS